MRLVGDRWRNFPNAARGALCAAALLAAALTASRAADEPGDTLRGLVFVPGMAAFNPDGVPALAEPVDLHRVGTLDRPSFAARMRALIGRPLTARTLDEIPALAAQVFEAAHRPLVQVTIPEQDVSSGIVQVVVTEFTIGRVLIEGAAHFPESLYRNAIGLGPGQPIDMGAIQSGQREINGSDYRAADIALRPGAQPATIDVAVQVRDRPPVSVTAGYNNAGTRVTGADQWTLGAGTANTVGNLDDILEYQFLSGDFTGHAPSVLGHAASYALTLPSIGTLSLLGSYTLTRAAGEESSGIHGRTVQISPRFTSEVYASAATLVFLRTGYDFKSTNNDLLFGGDAVARGSSDISQFELEAIGGRADDWGRTDATAAIVASPGGMMPGNDDASFARLSADARARYLYARLDATRSTALPGDLAWWTHVVGQLASNGLLPSEQLNAGGLFSVRGYRASTARGDSGIMLSNELRFSAGGFSRFLGRDLGERLQPFVFLDYAGVRARGAASQPAGGTLTSFGPGLRIDIDRYAALALDAGAQLRRDGGRHYPGQFFDIAVTVRY